MFANKRVSTMETIFGRFWTQTEPSLFFPSLLPAQGRTVTHIAEIVGITIGLASRLYGLIAIKNDAGAPDLLGNYIAGM